MPGPEHRITSRPRRKRAELAGPEYKVFHGVGAVITEIKSDTLFSVAGVVTDEQPVDFANTDLRFSIDMTRTPNRIGKTAWAKVSIDDRGIDAAGKEWPTDTLPMQFSLAMTSIGAGSTDDIQRGAFLGAVYLEHSVYLSLRDTKLSGWPETPGDFSLLQLTSIAYSGNPSNGPRADTRYHGFPAKVIAASGGKFTVEIRERGEPKQVTFAKGDATTYDPDPPTEALGKEVSLANDLSVGKSGALFVELKTAVRAMLDGIKLPIGEG